MAEFGIASGAIGVISLGLEIAKGLLHYYGAWKDRDKDVSSMCDSADHLSRILTMLSSKIEPPAVFDPIVKANVEENINTVSNAIQTLKAELDAIQATTVPSPKPGIRSSLRRHMYRALYPFKEETLRKIRTTLTDARSNMNLVLQVLHIDEIQDINQKVHSIVRWKQDEETRRIVEWLSPVNFWLKQADVLRQRQPGTGQWLLKNQDFLDWENGSKHSLWCQGSPGVGKTVLTAIIVEFLEQDLPDPDIGMAFFYCNYKENLVQSTEYFLRAIIRQLVEKRLTIPEDVYCLYKHHCGKETPLTLPECLELLQALCKEYSEMYVVIDALDECINHARESFWSELLYKLNDSIPNLHFLCTSRHIEDARGVMKKAARIEIRANDADIEAYIRDVITSKDNLAQLCQQDPHLQEDIVSKIASKVDGMFLTAQFYVDSLSAKENLRAVRRALKSLPDGLDNIYNDTMNRIQQLSTQKLALRVIPWVVYAERPLQVAEIQHAIAINDLEPEDYCVPKESLVPLNMILNSCGGLIRVDERGIIGLVHYTAHEYFDRHGLRHFPHAQRDIGISCIKYLSLDVFGEGPCQEDDLYEFRLKENPLLEYAASHALSHLRSQTQDFDVYCLVEQFLKDEPKLMSAVQTLSYYELRDFDGIHYTAYVGSREFTESLLKTVSPDTTDYDDRTPLSYAAENGQEEVVELLVSQDDINPNARDHEGKTPLHYAALDGHDIVVELLLTHDNIDINLRDKHGRTPLSMAASMREDTVVNLLLSRDDIDPHPKDNFGYTPLYFASKTGSDEVVQLLLTRDSVDPDTMDHDGRTPLSRAAESLHEDVIKLLLARDDVDPNRKDKKGRTPLSYAVNYILRSADEMTLVTKLFLALDSVDLQTKDNNGRTLLSHAAQGGSENVVKLLLARHLDPDVKDNNGQTPLSYAAKGGFKDIVKLLLSRNDVGPDSKDNDGRTPLSYAAKGGFKDIVKLLLSRNDVGPDSKDNDGRTPLSYAAKGGFKDIVKLLLSRNDIDPDSKDSNGRTPLSYAAEQGSQDVVNWLLSRNDVDPEAKDNNGRTALSYAAKGGSEDMIKLLLSRNDVDPDAKDNNGRTPLSYAVERKTKDVVKLFLSRNDVDPETRDNQGRTPLSHAARQNSVAVVEYLLSRNDVDPDSKDNNGRTPLSWTAWTSQENIQLFLSRADIDPDSKDNQGQTPLSYLAEAEYSNECVELYLAMENVDPNAKDNLGRTILSYAVESDCLRKAETVELLLAIDNVDPDAKDNQGRTPLSYAAEIGRGQAVESLLSRYDVDPDSKDDNGQTPIMIAKKKGYYDIAELIAQEIEARQEEQAESMSEENDNEYANGTIRPYPFDTSDEDSDASSTRETKRIVIRGIREDREDQVS